MILEPVPQEEEVSAEPPTTPKIWRSCCIEVDKQAIMYFSQLGVGLLILGFSGVQLLRSNFECDQSAPYLSLLSFIIGTYVPRLSK